MKKAYFKSISENGDLAKTYIISFRDKIIIERFILMKSNDKNINLYEVVKKFKNKCLIHEYMVFKSESLYTVIQCVLRFVEM